MSWRHRAPCMSRFGIIAVALAVAVALFIAGRQSADASFPGDNSAEVGFARDMAIHHSQAIEMSLFVLRKPVDETIRTMAVDITLTQQAQIGQMHGWLAVWDLPIASSNPPMQWAGHPGGHMKGMATREQLNALEDSSPPETEKQFLRLMISHHQGGAEMAQAILNRSDVPEVRQLAQAIFNSQAAEIKVMQQMLTDFDA